MKSLTVISLLSAIAAACAQNAAAQPAPHVLLEAEAFVDQGGWALDQQSMDEMGSPYLLAHGLGEPVADAATRHTFSAPTRCRVWVRTRNWVATWGVKEAPGRFQVLIDGKPLPADFGTQGAEWAWQDGGLVDVSGEVTVALHDLTGFEGRCDAILLTADTAFQPPNDREGLAAFRRAARGLPIEPDQAGPYDLVVTGGGFAGICTAISAARQGLRVVLIHDRPLLGGNGSSEVRVWPEGHTKLEPFPQLGDIVEELLPAKPSADAPAGTPGSIFDDGLKQRVAKAEPNLTLAMEQRAQAVVMRDGRIGAVTATHLRTGRQTSYTGRLFADCTGDAVIGHLAGADTAVSEEEQMGASNPWKVVDLTDPKQVIHCECRDKEALSLDLSEGRSASPFPRLPWALDLREREFPGRDEKDTPKELGGWYWESGFHLDMIRDVERIRDLNLRAMYGAWDTLKNDDGRYPTHRIGWSAFIAGKRESRRLLGDVILTGKDLLEGKKYPDGIFPCTWHIDVHSPDAEFAEGDKADAFISTFTHGEQWLYRGPYWVPYRCLYSRNVPNLFMAGRDISVDREALGAVRVMKTCGMMGEVLGRAAYLCILHGTSPRGVYKAHLEELFDLIRHPGVMRRNSLTGPIELPPGKKPDIRPVPEGIVLDDWDAELSGPWTRGANLRSWQGGGYRYSKHPAAEARFRLPVEKAGPHELRLTWAADSARAKQALVIVTTPQGEKELRLDQSRPPRGPLGFQSLGTFPLEPGNASIRFLAKDADGFVHLDALQIIPRSAEP